MEQPEAEDKPADDLALELELVLLGTCLINSAGIDLVTRHVGAADFSTPLLGGIWSAMVTMQTEGVAITPKLLAAKISTPRNLEILKKDLGLTMVQFLGRMANEGTTILNAEHYAKAIREQHYRRSLAASAATLGEGLRDPGASFRDVCGSMSAAIELALRHQEPPAATVKELVARSVLALDPNRIPPGVTTGLRDLDRRIGGLVAGDLVIIGGRPSMGKTTLGCCIANLSAQASYRERTQDLTKGPDAGWGVLLMSHEMTHEQVVHRWLTDTAFGYGESRTPVMYERFRPPPGVKIEELTGVQQDGIDKAARLLPELPLRLDGRPGMKVSELTAAVRLHKARMAKKGIRLALVVVDHIGLGKIVPDGKHDTRVNELGEITSSLKALAVNEEMAVVALHQLSRASEGRDNKRPTLADFRDSGHIEQDADIMIGVYRDSYYLERSRESDQAKEVVRLNNLRETQHDMEVHVLKNRLGSVGHVSLWVHMGANVVRDAAPYSYQN